MSKYKYFVKMSSPSEPLLSVNVLAKTDVAQILTFRRFLVGFFSSRVLRNSNQ